MTPLERPVIVLGVKNWGIQPIAAYKLSIEVFNKFDEPIQKFGFGENETVGIDQDELGTGGSRECKWALYGQDTAAKFKVYVLRLKL